MVGEPPTVLLVDDEPGLLDVLERYLCGDGFRVLRAGDGPLAVELAALQRPDLIVLDIGLPGFSGTEVLRRVRGERNIPIIMLTARGDEIDRVVGLELGADDYITKPFSPREVLARVRSVLRRTTPSSRGTDHSALRSVGQITIDPAGHAATVGGKPVMLTPTQFRLLDIFSRHLGQTLTREQLLDLLRGDDIVYDRTLDRHIANLRSRIEADPANPRYILTVFGVGYKMVQPV